MDTIDVAQRSMTQTPIRRQLHRVGSVAWVASLPLCFGALGLIWALPAMRRRARRKAARCATCRRHQRWSRALVAAFILLQAVGVTNSAHAAIRPPPPCQTHVFSTHGAQPESQPQNGAASPAWGITRDVVTASTSGLALLGAKAAGMHRCAGSPHTVAFWQPHRTDGGGSTVGDTFLAWKGSNQQHPGRTADTHSSATESPYLRYGPHISATRTNEADLSRHESRHTDQWAVFTLVGGPVAFPAAYYADSALFPFARNHFERAAGLDDGGYREPPGTGPEPIWTAVAAMGVALLLILRTRIRRLSRALVTGRTRTLSHHAPGRCATHTTGWLSPRRRPLVSKHEPCRQ